MAEGNDELIPGAIVTGERNYRQALQQVIARAERELLIFDNDLSIGDYASLQRYEAVRGFLAGGGQRLVMVLHESRYFTNDCPRLFELLALYGHRMTVYQTNDSAKVARDIFIVADGKHYLRRFHIDQARFRYAFDDEETCAMLKRRFDELLEATGEAVTATTLGL